MKAGPGDTPDASEALVERFIAMLAAERGAAANTIAAYRRDLAAAREVLGAGMAQAGADDIAGLGKAWGDLAASSLARRCSALRQFYGFLVDEGERDDDPSPALPRPTVRRPLPRLLSREEVERFLQQAEEEAGSERREAVRLLALVEMLYGSGLRATELVSLPVSAVPRDAPFVHVTGKGGQQRLVPVSTRARQALSRWMAIRGEVRGSAGGTEAGKTSARFLFPSSGASGHLTRVRLFQLLRALALRADIDPERVSPHVLRHAFASHLLAGGADLRVLQMLLGHADITTTQIYTHVEAERLVALVNARHPLSGSRISGRSGT